MSITTLHTQYVLRQNLSLRFLSSLLSVYVLTEPILSIYGWIGNSFADIIAIFVAFFFIIFKLIKRVQTNIPKYLGWYFIWLLLNNYLSFNRLLPLGDILHILLFLACFSIVEFNSFYKLYKSLAKIFIAFFIFQEITYALLGYRVLGIIEWMPICFGGENFDMSYYTLSREISARSSSFFSEPAHFAQFLTPLLAIELYKSEKIKDFLFPIIITIVLLLLQSGNALTGLCCSFLFFFIKLFKSRGRNKVGGLCLLTFLLLISISYFNSDARTSLKERQNTVTGEIDTSSGFIRMFRGYYIWDEYSSLEKITGINNISIIKNKINQCKVSWTFADENDTYVNCVQNIMLRTGFIGLLLVVAVLMFLWRGNSYTGKSILLSFVGLSFMSALYMSPTMILYLFLAYHYKIEYTNKI